MKAKADLEAEALWKRYVVALRELEQLGHLAPIKRTMRNLHAKVRVQVITAQEGKWNP